MGMPPTAAVVTTGRTAAATTGRTAVMTTGRTAVVTTGRTAVVTTGRTAAATTSRAAASTAGREQGPTRCLWCARELPAVGSLGRRRRYCAQACRQRAYENRNALQRGGLPADAVVLSADERDDLADRLYQVRCAAEDVATALAEGARPGELASLVDHLVRSARQAEHIR